MAINVAGAFKVLIEAQPDKAMAAFDAVLKSTKSAQASTVTWADTVTALNSAYQLTSSVISGIASVARSAAGALASAGSGLLDLVKLGGEYQEQAGQFDILVKSVGGGANTIIGSIREITDNTINWKEQTMLATKAIATGLSPEQLATTFTFIKKFTESTGESFTQVSEKVLKAFSSGRFKSLQELGFNVDKGETAASFIEKMGKGIDAFGNAGFNAADKFASLGNSIELFVAKIGQALNASPELQAILTSLADAASGFANNFSGERQKSVTDFFNTLLKGAKDATSGMLADFGITSQTIDAVFSDGAGKARVFFGAIVETYASFNEIVKSSFAAVSNTVLSVISFFGEGFYKIKALALSVIGGIAEGLNWLITEALNTGAKFFQTIEKMADSAGSLFSYLPGFDAELYEEQKKSITDISKEFLKMSAAQEKFTTDQFRTPLAQALADGEEFVKWAEQSRISLLDEDETDRSIAKMRAYVASIQTGKLSGFTEIYSRENGSAAGDTMGGRLLYDSAEGGPKGTLATTAGQLAAAQAALTEALKAAASTTWVHQIQVSESGAFVDSFIEQVFAAAGVRAKAEGVQVPGL